ncbi:MAG: hypothetical protein HY701_06415, partial [Gemmatimonadetes bacterium]|nr:hypothetical protein [Gemmatimonadota bacterium]
MRSMLMGSGALALGLLALASCDFAVTNPGPIHDADLDNPAAHTAVVVGSMRGLMQGLGNFAYYGGALSRDLHAGAHTFSSGIPFQIELGLLSDEWTAGGGWNNTHDGRWIAEHMAERTRQAMGAAADSYKALGQFYLWAGLANRVLGENVCTAVFDGGGTEPYMNHFKRAVEHFTQAERIAAAAGDNQTRLAAIGARASAHMYLGNWAQAAADASQVPASFALKVPYSNNTIYDIPQAMGWTFRSITFWDTPYEDYFPATGDPRVAWGNDPKVKAAVARPTWGRILPFYYPLKFYAPRHADELTRYNPVATAQYVIPVNLVTGREMPLVRAEALLKEGKWPEAMALINQVRTTTADLGTGKFGSYFTGKALSPVTATSLEEAWAALKFERLVELNM